MLRAVGGAAYYLRARINSTILTCPSLNPSSLPGLSAQQQRHNARVGTDRMLKMSRPKGMINRAIANRMNADGLLKLRCSREHPKCERCLRLGATCVFPEPPDRKKLASQRASTRKRKAEDSGCLPDMSASIVQAGPFALMSPNSGPNSPYRSSATYMPKQTSPLPVANDEIHIPQQAEKALHAVYFNCIFNASMLFQRDDFAKSLAEGSIARHTRLAICALASKYERHRRSRCTKFANSFAASSSLAQPNTTFTLQHSKMLAISRLKANIGHPQLGERSCRQLTCRL